MYLFFEKIYLYDDYDGMVIDPVCFWYCSGGDRGREVISGGMGGEIWSQREVAPAYFISKELACFSISN